MVRAVARFVHRVSISIFVVFIIKEVAGDMVMDSPCKCGICVVFEFVRRLSDFLISHSTCCELVDIDAAIPPPVGDAGACEWHLEIDLGVHSLPLCGFEGLRDVA